SRLPTIPGADKAVLLTSAGNSSSNSRSSYGDIFAEQLGVTLSLNNNTIRVDGPQVAAAATLVTISP
ncbi:MAG: hypothetical protein R3248_14420, partial [Candidatus Promineifilaceae bacterium]|nr:hypothetical protein [Candidatus Promineifilaceae bacterium]